MHLNERPFICEFNGCDKRFNLKPHLDHKLAVHLGVKPYKCHYNDCNYKYSLKGDIEMLSHINVMLMSVINVL